MKKILVIFTLVFILAAFAGCEGKMKDEETAKRTETSVEATDSEVATESESETEIATETESATETEITTESEIVTKAPDPAKTIVGTWGMNPTDGSETHLEFTADGRVINRDFMFGTYTLDGANVNVTFADFADQKPIVYNFDGSTLVIGNAGEGGEKKFDRMTGESGNAAGTYICYEEGANTVITLSADGRITYSLTTYARQTYKISGNKLTLTTVGNDAPEQSTSAEISFPDSDTLIMSVDGKDVTMTRID